MKGKTSARLEDLPEATADQLKSNRSGQGSAHGADDNQLLPTDNDATGAAEDDELFGTFKFRSFKNHKLLEEDYDLLNIEDPEDVTNINT